MTLTRPLLAAASALTLLAGAGSATAQDTAPTPAPQVEQPAAAAPTLDDGKLKSFAVAFLEVSRVGQEYRGRIEAAGTSEDQQQLEREAGKKMVDAVNASQGISVDEYNSIIEAAQADPGLAQRINGHITEVAGAQPAPPATPSE